MFGEGEPLFEWSGFSVLAVYKIGGKIVLILKGKTLATNQ